MKFSILCTVFISFFTSSIAQPTPFEKSSGTASATYFEAIKFFGQLDKASGKVQVKTMGATDAGYPLHLVMVSANGNFDPVAWHKQNKAVVLILNGIHPGEPDGIDASMLLVRDIVKGTIKLPANVCLGIIPVYNIGGSLNRGTSSRANQNGPVEYGFRGNSQNLDLNRDFTKNDSREAKSFAKIFHYLDPDIQVDNHVSDGADYQHTMTMLTTQPDKLGGDLGDWLKNKFEPSLYKSMSDKGWDMTPYVNFESADLSKGMDAFYDPPRYSSGYAALWQTIAFVPETHMLKPFKDRVLSTYAFMKTIIEESSSQVTSLKTLRAKLKVATSAQNSFPLSWEKDTTQYSLVTFKGYETGMKISEATGLERMFYDHSKPNTRTIPFYNSFNGTQIVTTPIYYIIPQGWYAVTDLLQLNKVKMIKLKTDTTIDVQSIKIAAYQSSPTPYEKHHRKSNVRFDTLKQQVSFLKGDYLIPMNQRANRFIAEMLEPAGADSYFAWNFFDGVLQQKEGYSDYRWEDVAATVLQADTSLQQLLLEKKKTDLEFSKDGSAQLNFIYKHSNYYEPGHMRYPVFKIVAAGTY
ncbi:MAG: M14 family metallopeptidase [Bacteroidota bacterium]